MTVATIYFTTDAAAGVAGHIEREYGSHGYRFGPIGTLEPGKTVFSVLASDGARFRLSVDPYGNVDRLCEHHNPDTPVFQEGDHCDLPASWRRNGRTHWLCGVHALDEVDAQIAKEATR